MTTLAFNELMEITEDLRQECAFNSYKTNAPPI